MRKLATKPSKKILDLCKQIQALMKPGEVYLIEKA